MRYLLLCLLCYSSFQLSAQLPVSEAFSDLLSEIDLQLEQPEGAVFKLKPNPKNDYLKDQLTLYSKAEKLEMRFHIVPETTNDIYYQRPHMRASLLVMNLGSNAEDAVTTVHSFDEEELTVLNADWARMYTFRPKTSYSPHAHAQLIACYKQERGLAYTVLLFDKAPGTLEDRQLVLRFK